MIKLSKADTKFVIDLVDNIEIADSIIIRANASGHLNLWIIDYFRKCTVTINVPLSDSKESKDSKDSKGESKGDSDISKLCGSSELSEQYLCFEKKNVIELLKVRNSPNCSMVILMKDLKLNVISQSGEIIFTTNLEIVSCDSYITIMSQAFARSIIVNGGEVKRMCSILSVPANLTSFNYDKAKKSVLFCSLSEHGFVKWRCIDPHVEAHDDKYDKNRLLFFPSKYFKIVQISQNIQFQNVSIEWTTSPTSEFDFLRFRVLASCEPDPKTSTISVSYTIQSTIPSDSVRCQIENILS